MTRRVSPVKKAPRLLPAILVGAIIAIVFTMLMIRLQVTEEGYRLSQLQSAIEQQHEQNRRLRLQVAELGSHQRLRALAARYHLGAPQRGQVVMAP